MTLSQLYAPSASAAGSAPAAAAASASTPPQGRSPLYAKDAAAARNMQPQPQMDRVYQMPYAPQYAPPSYGHPPQYLLTKAGPSTSEDYAADPLPFEYTGIRKYKDADGPRGSTASVSTAPHYADAYAPHPMYTAARPGGYGQQPQYPEPRGPPYHHEIPAHFPRSSQPMYTPMPGSGMLPLPGHSFPPLLDAQHGALPKKEVDPSAYTPQVQVHGSSGYGGVAEGPRGPTGPAQEAMIKVKTPLKLKYWRNGRRNLQCFPSCKVFGDYSAIKIEDLKQHDFMWGKCRGSLVTEVTLNSGVAFDDLVLLGRVHSLENVPVAFEEAVIRECMLGRAVEPEVLDAMKDQWISGERLPDFVQPDGHVACFEFKPKVWKYTEDMAQGKCKRRNVKYYVQFEAFVPVQNGDHRYFACIGSGMSTSFEVGSSRVLARQKRKAAAAAPDLADKAGRAAESARAAEMAAMQQMPPHMLMQHPMAGQMYPFHHDAVSRGLPPTFPQMQPEMHYAMPQPAVGEKRKMSSDRPPFPTDRAAKMLKPMSGVPQSVPI
ncbi:hypothetical protein BBJ28_00005703 [Nothophytophthora sp. Chile5]|nr:hypothetical protein BBJ28_00005703 [Nothophytophthora sp. Chile5]